MAWRVAPATVSMRSIPLFWLLALVLVAATVAALVWPLLRSRSQQAIDLEDDAKADVSRDQQREQIVAMVVEPGATGGLIVINNVVR